MYQTIRLTYLHSLKRMKKSAVLGNPYFPCQSSPLFSLSLSVSFLSLWRGRDVCHASLVSGLWLLWSCHHKFKGGTSANFSFTNEKTVSSQQLWGILPLVLKFSWDNIPQYSIKLIINLVYLIIKTTKTY